MKKYRNHSIRNKNQILPRKCILSIIIACTITLTPLLSSMHTQAAQEDNAPKKETAQDGSSKEKPAADGTSQNDTAQDSSSQNDTAQDSSSKNDTAQDSSSKENKTPDGSSKNNTGDEEESGSGQVPPADSLPAVTSIDPLTEEEAFLSFDSKPSLEEVTALFPAVLSVHMDGSDDTVPLPVTWECTDGYEETESDVYEFTPVWDTTAYPASGQLKSWDIPSIIVSIRSSLPDYFLTDADQAETSLASLAKEKDILALIYLCDSYLIKEAPDADAATLANVSTGQSVQITGVAEDDERNIWYLVKTVNGGSEYTGYVERKYLAYSDEDFLEWEKESVSTNPALAATPMSLTQDSIPEDIKAFPSSYQSALMKLKEQHPNWIFVNMKTEVDFYTAVKQENSKDRSLISSKSNASWKAGAYDNAWSYPTDGILAYYMDPRNFLNEKHIFQFELLSYNSTYHTESAVQGILKNTFMSGPIPEDEQGRTYAQAFYSIAKNLGVSPFHLASRVRQEQGDGKSALISGTYPGYTGLYNYFNIGATGKGNAQVIENGLAKAREYGWTTRYLSLAGGADMISKNYIRKGQDTLYLQKFNVSKTSASGLYNHQYMQNIAAPSAEAVSVKNAYASAGSVNNPFVFRIPVYENMPANPCPQPADLKRVTLDQDTLTLKAGETCTLTAQIDGKAAAPSSVSFSSSDANIASVDANGTVTALAAGSAKISCTVSGGTTAVCTVTVQKNVPPYTVPVLNPVTYAPDRTLKDIPLPTGWAWENPAIVPTVNNSGYPAVYTPADTGRYDTVKQTLALTVSKGTPAYTVPTGLQTAAGNTLASIKLPAGFVWDKPDTVLGKAGTFSHMASYNPDASNYQTVTGIPVSVTVTEKAPACTSHTYGGWVVTTPATCTKAGTQARSCQQCGAEENTAIPAAGHNYVSAVTKQPTENETGVRTYTCGGCGDTYTEEIAKLPATHKHSYTASVTTAAVCGKTGVKTYTCSCGDTYTETVPALAHTYTSKITKEASETEAGIRTYTCDLCGHTYTESIAKLPASHKHAYSSSVAKQPTCTDKGVKSYVCSCGDTYSEETAALGHDMADGTCSRCGYTVQTQKPGTGNGDTGNNNTGNNSSSGSGNTNNRDDNNSDNGNDGNSSDSNNGNDGNSNDSSSDNGRDNGSTTPPASAAGGSPAQNNGNTTGNPSSGSQPPAANQTGNTSADSRPTGSGTKPPARPEDVGSQNNGGATIDMQKNAVLYEETLSALRGQDIDVTLDMGNNIRWIINGKNIVADEANGIDMGVKPDAGNIPEALMAQAVRLSETGTAIALSLSHDGAFEFQPVLSVHTDAGFAGRFATLFYHNADTGLLEYVGETTVTEAGDILFTFSHASDYVIVISSTSLSSVTSVDSTGIMSTAGQENAPVETPEDADILAVNAVPAQEEEKAATGFPPAVLFITVLILLLLAAIGGTAFFLFRSREDADAQDNDWPDLKSRKPKTGIPDIKDFDEEDSVEISSVFDEESAEDDYREPGSASGMEERKKEKRAEDAQTEEYDDGFDGFE